MTNKEIASTVDRYLFATIGMFLSAVGIAMTIVSNIGTAPLSCPSYVMNLRFPAVSVGTWTLIVNCTYMLIQLALLRKQFKAADLLQVVASAIFGYMIDISLAGMGWLNPSGMPARMLRGVRTEPSAVTNRPFCTEPGILLIGGLPRKSATNWFAGPS